MQDFFHQQLYHWHTSQKVDIFGILLPLQLDATVAFTCCVCVKLAYHRKGHEWHKGIFFVILPEDVLILRPAWCFFFSSWGGKKQKYGMEHHHPHHPSSIIPVESPSPSHFSRLSVLNLLIAGHAASQGW